MRSLSANPLSPRTVNISWQPPLHVESILDYKIILTLQGRNNAPQSLTTSSTSTVVDSLYSGSFYLCIVTSRTTGGRQSSTDILFQMPPDGEGSFFSIDARCICSTYESFSIIIYYNALFPVTVPSGYPLHIVAVAPDSDSLYLYWSPPPLEEQNGNILYYGINVTEEESGNVSHYLTSYSKTSYVVYGLHPYYHYQYQLAAVTRAGHGPYSPPDSIQLPQEGKYSTTCKIIVRFSCEHYHDSITPNT